MKNYNNFKCGFRMVCFFTVQTRDFSSAKDVLKMYAEEEVKPSPETINYLNKQLTANGMEKVQDLQVYKAAI